jgi:uncharacterized protein (DUF58 family)
MTRNGVTVVAIGVLGAALWLVLGVGWARWVPSVALGLLVPGARIRLLPIASYRAALELASTAAIHRGDEVRLVVHLAPASGLPIRSVLVDVDALGVPVRQHLRARHPGRHELPPVPADRRGDFRCAVRRIVARDMLGLWERTIRFAGTDLAVRVLPKALPCTMANPNPRYDDEGTIPSAVATGGTMFAALREYEPGDDVRLIHWTASAATADESILVRENARTVTPELSIALSTTAPDAATFEVAVDITYSLALGADGPVTVTADGKTVHGSACTDLLVDVRPSGPSSTVNITIDGAAVFAVSPSITLEDAVRTLEEAAPR